MKEETQSWLVETDDNDDITVDKQWSKGETRAWCLRASGVHSGLANTKESER